MSSDDLVGLGIGLAAVGLTAALVSRIAKKTTSKTKCKWL